jgi:UDP-N-acetylmuramyl pentapeptide phosphotransferase/UDP-N-acetylglucosamine-1-phosphate transferase
MIQSIKQKVLLIIISPLFVFVFPVLFFIYTYGNKKDMKKLKNNNNFANPPSKGGFYRGDND